MSREDFQKKMEAWLRELPKPLVVAFPARATACALPYIAGLEATEFLGFWKQADRERHLLAVFRSLLFAYGVALKVGVASIDDTNATVFTRLSATKSAHEVISGATDAVADAQTSVAAWAASPEGERPIYTAYAAGFLTFVAFTAIVAAHGLVQAVRLAPADAGHLSSDARITAAVSETLDESFTNLGAEINHAVDLRAFLLEEIADLGKIADSSTYLARSLPRAIEPQTRYFVAKLRDLGSGFDWWAGWYEERLRGEPFDLALLERCLTLPESLLQQGPAAVNAYLKTLTRHEATRPLNRIRVIFIGYGQSGKTSLIRALHDEPVIAGKEDMTPGIEIRDWPVPGSEIKAHFWDFGGQVMAHATHQFFLRERCVYVLVMEPRAEINANQQAQYWLEYVRLFGKDAPVLLVGNKADRLALHLDLNTLKDSYPNIVGFFPISCTGYRDRYQPQFEIFRSALVGELQMAGTHQLLFTPRHFGVLEDLRNRPKHQAFLEKQEFERLCEQHKVEATEDLNPDWLLDLLDKLGVVVHFAGLDWLGAYVLNPRWLTYGVYTLLYSDEARQATGRLTQRDVITVLGRGECRDNLGNPLEFPPIHCRFILDAMQRFELCYALPDTVETYILPDLLPSDRPADLGFDKNQALAFDFDFEALLPRHLMTGFIVRRHGEIPQQQVWQNGVRLSSRNWWAEALVQADHHRRRLSLWVAGPQAARYFTALHDELMAMLDRMNMDRSRFQEWVALPGVMFAPGKEPPRADFRDLLALEAAGETQYVCKYGKFELAEVLKIMPKDEREKLSRETHIHAQQLIYQEQGRDAFFRDSPVSIQPGAEELDRGLADLLYRIRVDVDRASVRDKALRELEMIREALQDLQGGDEGKKRPALQILSRFGDHVKAGTSGTVEALKTIKDGGEAVSWLMEKVPLVVEALARWLG